MPPLSDRPGPGHPEAGRAGALRAGAWGRRRVLTGGLLAGVGLTGLTGCLGDDKPKAGKPDPLRPVLAGTLALRAYYDATAAHHPDLAARLAPLRADHDAHAKALKAALASPASTTSPSPTPSPSVPAAPADALAALVTAEQQAQQTAAKGCLAGPAATATLLGAIAACRASHQAALR